jgi:hypothetical protein
MFPNVINILLIYTALIFSPGVRNYSIINIWFKNIKTYHLLRPFSCITIEGSFYRKNHEFMRSTLYDWTHWSNFLSSLDQRKIYVALYCCCCRMHKLRSTGILRRLNTNVDTQLPKNEASFDISMDFISVAPIFGILAVGMMGAISVLLLEFGLYKMKPIITRQCTNMQRYWKSINIYME